MSTTLPHLWEPNPENISGVAPLLSRKLLQQIAQICYHGLSVSGLTIPVLRTRNDCG
ncbi:hypothetical protein [Microcystis sp. M_OC_Ca_00000000_S217Cul]|uniref:hypothetical protein n=1 Tax=Microcystis sp. M_OC_Ca_00000000_S217Cul TaxID=2486214 RepID=UPI00257CFA58|nr:hypothetical protein [Microcystis sp. M_OC_Ca_00000000_S217Cul]